MREFVLELNKRNLTDNCAVAQLNGKTAKSYRGQRSYGRPRPSRGVLKGTRTGNPSAIDSAKARVIKVTQGMLATGRHERSVLETSKRTVVEVMNDRMTRNLTDAEALAELQQLGESVEAARDLLFLQDRMFTERQ